MSGTRAHHRWPRKLSVSAGMADGELEARFKKAVWLIRNGPPIKDARSTNQSKLQFYKYFKQARPRKQTIRTMLAGTACRSCCLDSDLCRAERVSLQRS